MSSKATYFQRELNAPRFSAKLGVHLNHYFRSDGHETLVGHVLGQEALRGNWKLQKMKA
jgi:hypothetical protein